MEEMLLLKYGEIALKGLNKKSFEDVLVKNIKRRLRHIGSFEYTRAQSTLYIKPQGDEDIDEVLAKLTKVFGVTKICRAIICKKDFSDIVKCSLPYL